MNNVDIVLRSTLQTGAIACTLCLLSFLIGEPDLIRLILSVISIWFSILVFNLTKE